MAVGEISVEFQWSRVRVQCGDWTGETDWDWRESTKKPASGWQQLIVTASQPVTSVSGTNSWAVPSHSDKVKTQ